MKTIQTTLAAMMVALFLSSALVAQNNDAPAPLSSWHGREYTIDTKASTFAIDFTDTTLFSNTWRYMALGWQWSYEVPRIMNKRLGVNVQPGSTDRNGPSALQSAPENRTIYWNFKPTTIYNQFTAQALEWHPAIVAQNIYDFTPTPGDTSGAVLGFRNRRYGRAVTTPGTR